MILYMLCAISYFIGVILHEFGHKIFCNITGVKVHYVKYFHFGARAGEPDGFVIHDKPKYLRQAVLITLGPMLTVGLAIIAITISLYWFAASFELLYASLIGLILAMFPSSVDLDNLAYQIFHHKKLNKILKRICLLFCKVMHIFTITLVKIILAIALLTLISTHIPFSEDMQASRIEEVRNACIRDCQTDMNTNKVQVSVTKQDGTYLCRCEADYTAEEIKKDLSVQCKQDCYTDLKKPVKKVHIRSGFFPNLWYCDCEVEQTSEEIKKEVRQSCTQSCQRDTGEVMQSIRIWQEAGKYVCKCETSNYDAEYEYALQKKGGLELKYEVPDKNVIEYEYGFETK